MKRGAIFFGFILFGILFLSFVSAYTNNDFAAYWNLNETSGTVAYEHFGIYNGNISGASVNQSGKVGTAYSFDGIDDYFNFNLINLGTNYSISYFVKFDNFSDTSLISDGGSSDYIYYKTRSLFQHRVGGGTVSSFDISHYPATDNLWEQYVLTRNGMNLKLYKDGIQVGGNQTLAEDYNWTINRVGGYTSVFFNGTVDEIALFNKTLSSSEIDELFQRGELNISYLKDTCSVNSDCSSTNCASYNSCYSGKYRNYENRTNSCSSGFCTFLSCNVYSETGTDSDGDEWDVQCGDTADNNALIYPSSTEYCFDGVDNDLDGFMDCDDRDCSGSVCYGVKAYWKMDETSGNTAYDYFTTYSGNNSNAQINQSGIVGTSYSFNGVNSTVDFNSINLGTNYSISYWVKFNTISATSDAVFVSDGSSTNYIYHRDANTIQHKAGGGTAVSFNIASYSSTPGAWEQYVLTRSGLNLILYKNGTQIGAGNLSSDSNLTISNIGGYAGAYVNGTVDEVILFNKTLSLSEIELFYPQTLSGTGHFEVSCTTDSDCPGIRCLDYDGCYPGIYYDYAEVDGSCVNNICAPLSCTSFERTGTDGDFDNYDSECGDCNDADSTVYPGANEICYDSLDNTCDNIIDEDCNYNNYLDGFLKSKWVFDEGTGNTTRDIYIWLNHGYLNNINTSICWTSGIVKTAVSLDGVNDYLEFTTRSPIVQAGTSLDMGTKNMSVELWIKTLDNNFSFYNKSDSGCEGQGYCADLISGDFVLKTSDGDLSQNYTVADFYVSDNVWHHVFVLYDRSSSAPEVYLDSVLQTGTKYGSDLSDISGNVSSNSSLFFGIGLNGSLDEITFYDRIVSSEEVQNFYTEKFFVGDWSFDIMPGKDFGGSQARDDSFWGNNANLINLGNSSWVNRTTGNAILFNESNSSYLEVSDNRGIDIENSNFSISFWIKTTDGNFTFYDHENSNQGYTATILNNYSTFKIGDGTNFQILNVSSSEIVDGEWHFVAVIYNKNNNFPSIYIDNILKSGTETGDDLDLIGNISYSGSFTLGDNLEGTMDEFKITKRVLSSSEILDLYEDYFLIGKWDFNEGSGNVAKDRSYYANDGNFTNLNWIDGRIGKALEFNRSDYIQLPDNNSLILYNKSFTFMGWAETNSTQDTQTIFLSGSNSSEGFWIYFNDSRIFFESYINGNSFQKINSSVLNVSQRYHLAVARDYASGLTNLYINGELKDGFTATGNLGTGDSEKHFFGGNGTSNFGFNGTLDEFVLYSKVLNSGEIAEVYENEGGEYGFGALENPTGNPIGGGVGYSDIINSGDADYFVNNKTDLLNALISAISGDIVYVNDSVELNLSGEESINIPANITLASGRGNGSSEGALLYSDFSGTVPLFLVGGDDVRITGLRIKGDDNTSDVFAYDVSVSVGIQTVYDNLEIDNNDISGWSQAAIYGAGGANEIFIHHNYIHHNQRQALGYGVELGIGSVDALIEGNLFNYNRHNVAGAGSVENIYEARYNLILNESLSHSLDMHGGLDRVDGTIIAGGSIDIHHNTFQYVDGRAVAIRGVPYNYVNIHHNWFYHNVSYRNATDMYGSDVIYTWGDNRNISKNVYTPGRIFVDKEGGSIQSLDLAAYSFSDLSLSNLTFPGVSEETPESSDSTSSPGGGGGSTSGIYNFSVDKDLIKIKIKQGEHFREEIVLENFGDSLNVKLEYENIGGFIIASEENFFIKKSETKKINLDFFAGENEIPDVYAGRIILSGGGIKKTINVIFEVGEKNPLFDVIVNIKKKEIYPGSKLAVSIKLLNMGDLKNIDVLLYYAIKDYEGNTVSYREESLAIKNELDLTRKIEFPSDGELGDYIFYAEARYNNITGSSAEDFEIVEKPISFFRKFTEGFISIIKKIFGIFTKSY